jgi:predicted RNA binding protein YcfA (HicA-like mRNA interferase family)
VLKSSDLIKLVKAAGWVLVSVKGSHHKFKHPIHEKPLIIPHPKQDLGVGITKKIKKQAGL